MAWFKKKTDFVSDRERALNAEIAQFEAQIKQLETQLHHDESHPRLRSTAVPQGATVAYSMTAAQAAPRPAPMHEPIFEELGADLLKPPAEGSTTPEHYNDLGVRKYDLPALWRRMQQNFRGPATTNPRLVSYLAAGGLSGLRPLRYEKRVARNRFIFATIFFVLILLGFLLVFANRH